MKKKFKTIIFLIPLLLFSSGCSATYKINIADGQIEESLNISESLSKANKNANVYKNGEYDDKDSCFGCLTTYANAMKNKYVEKFYISKENFERDNKTQGNNIYNDTYSFNIVNNKEISLKKNTILNNIVKDSLIVNDNNIILHLDTIPTGLLDEIDDVTITIYTELNVTSNNADTVDNNSYTWNIDKNNYLNKTLSMYIERPKTEQTKEDNKQNNNSSSKKDSTAFTLIIIIGIYLAIIIFVVNLFNKKKKLF